MAVGQAGASKSHPNRSIGIRNQSENRDHPPCELRIRESDSLERFCIWQGIKGKAGRNSPPLLLSILFQGYRRFSSSSSPSIPRRRANIVVATTDCFHGVNLVGVGVRRLGDLWVDARSGRRRWIDATLQILLHLDWPASRLHGSRGCFGCCTKPTPIIAVDEPSKSLKIQGQTVRKPNFSEDFWSTSTYEMENSGVQSQRSVSSISTSAQPFDHHGGAGSTSNPSEFVNHGNNNIILVPKCLLLWAQTRQHWTGNKKSEMQPQQLREPRLSWNATYESLLGSNKPFPQPIPLSEMVDFLVDIWEQEGLYD
ncbi:hypothetical protein ZIOFF_051411 [Zingiber officinale]|uniref:Gag1-like clamp domain-containing protein n=1 Tax=Zingiber officinale TaxID=94328 RepID=A0A8J5KUL1_ZINOF|nr:hypothetical protein ZIOFF_051411 [Zingiber officinale]